MRSNKVLKLHAEEIAMWRNAQDQRKFPVAINNRARGHHICESDLQIIKYIVQQLGSASSVLRGIETGFRIHRGFVLLRSFLIALSGSGHVGEKTARGPQSTCFRSPGK